MPKYFNDKGAIPLLVPIIIGVVAITGVFLLSNSSKKTTSPTTKQNTSSTTTSAQPTQIQWKDYKDEKYGYTLKKPDIWLVENLSDTGGRLIKVSSSDKSASVLIQGIAGPALSNQEELDKTITLLEGKLKSDPKYKVDRFSKKSGDGISGYAADGEIVSSNDNPDQKILFEETFLVAKNGRGLRMQAIYAAVNKDKDHPIVSEIMTSFKTN